MRVGFIGTGRMGTPMVRRLADAGHHVHALGRSDEKRRAITELNAHAVATVAETAERADAVVVCVFTDEQVKQVCLDSDLLAAMRPGSALILHTTGSPRTAEAIAAAATHVDVLDAPVSGSPYDIGVGELTLFVGGSDDAVARIQPVLASYADPILHVGPTGAGQGVKLINNTLFAAQIGLLSEAVQLGARFGVEEAKLLTSVTQGSGASRVSEFIAARGSVQAFVDGVVGEIIGKDIAVVRMIAAELGSELGLLDDVINAGIRP
jgi:3-hydroxyisobutyrate dehydrogenase